MRETTTTEPQVGEVWVDPLPVTGVWCRAERVDEQHLRVPFLCTRPAHEDDVHVAGGDGVPGSSEPGSRRLRVVATWVEA